MDKEVLKQRLTERFQRSLEEALKAVEDAPDGQWIAASEWEVRDIFQKLTADCFGQMIQDRIDGLPSQSQTVFSPDGRVAATAKQRKSRGAGVDRGRGD
jgi:hypothetical protein